VAGVAVIDQAGRMGKAVPDALPGPVRQGRALDLKGRGGRPPQESIRKTDLLHRSHAYRGSGTSSAGFSSKKLAGTRRKPILVVGITGHSSGRGIWVTFIVYQSTTSVFSMGSFLEV